MSSINILLGYIASTPNPQLEDDMRNILIKNIIEDVSNLLNTKPQNTDLLSYVSILDYGLPDLSYYSPYSTTDQNIVSRLIQNSIEHFEPRLFDIVVTPIVKDDNYGKIFRFQITANAILGSEKIAVILESEINNNTKILSIKDAKS